MNSEEPRQGWPAPPGHPPTGPSNGGYDGYGGGYGAPAPIVVARTSSHRGAWIGAGATLVAAVIGVVGTYLVSGNSDRNGTPPAAQSSATTSATPSGGESRGSDDAPSDSSQSPEATQSDEATQSGESSAPAETAATPTPPAKPAGTVEWQGPLAITFTDDKDLDSVPPVESEIRDENDFSVYPFGGHMLQPGDGVKALVWKDSTNKTPSYEDCARDIDTMATSTATELKTGMVFCAATNDGRLARLTVKELSAPSTETRGIFDVVVWSR
ncbi:hypothetical protein [Streptomyces sp. NBC_00572]|uniref:hypothetical protein n=1 Tax=Streptomyces sp. NBC_00572 TaxID=2903664 RepID=UPI002259C92D|nr:hypothetical protein [Streptomyces sp. NBC_00572]MCX4980642.1 hypothetical protein [Streptomyces sp. NBC_00572]